MPCKSCGESLTDLYAYTAGVCGPECAEADEVRKSLVSTSPRWGMTIAWDGAAPSTPRDEIDFVITASTYREAVSRAIALSLNYAAHTHDDTWVEVLRITKDGKPYTIVHPLHRVRDYL